MCKHWPGLILLHVSLSESVFPIQAFLCSCLFFFLCAVAFSPLSLYSCGLLFNTVRFQRLWQRNIQMHNHPSQLVKQPLVKGVCQSRQSCLRANTFLLLPLEVSSTASGGHKYQVSKTVHRWAEWTNIISANTLLTQRCFQRKVIVRKDCVYEHTELGLCWLESHNEMPNDPCGKPIGFPALSCSLESLLAVSWIMFPNQLDAKARKLTFTIIENISWFMSWQILTSTPLFRSHLFHSLIFNLACQFTFNHPLFHLSIRGVNDWYLINNSGLFVLYCPSHLYIHMPIIHHPTFYFSHRL